MVDYILWLRRAVEFSEGLRRLPGEVKLEIEVAPPLSEEEVYKVVQSCRLPIPEPLRRFWIEASAHCHCTYWWKTPAEFHQQLAFAFPDWSLPHFWGGPDFQSPHSIVELTESFLDWANGFREEYPKDARYWEHSLPLVPVGNGDWAGLYVRDCQDDPPVVYLCHDGCGGSDIIAANFDEFLRRWEELGYIGIHFLCSFCNRGTGLIDPDAYPQETKVVQALLSGVACSDLGKPQLTMTESDWMDCVDPDPMLEWLEEKRKVDERKLRLFCCACCRRVWDRMGEWSRRAVEVAERFADGDASVVDLEAARMGLLGVASGSKLQHDMANLEHFQKAIQEAVEFSKSQGLMHHAALMAVDANGLVSWEITKHFDEPELQLEKAAHADLIRHLFGNPFRPAIRPLICQLQILQLAKRLYKGEDCTTELHDALEGAGHHNLAEHFLHSGHPKGCWALDGILGK